jgi:hypothetical protein
LTDRVAPFQSRGQFGARDFDLYVFYVNIPLFNPENSLHAELANLAGRAEEVAAGVDLPAEVQFQAARRRVRAALDEDGTAAHIEAVLAQLIPPMSD